MALGQKTVFGSLCLFTLLAGCAQQPTSPDSGNVLTNGTVSRADLLTLLTELRDSVRSEISPEDMRIGDCVRE